MRFSSRVLEKELAEGHVSQREKAKYLVFAVLICQFTWPLEIIQPMITKSESSSGSDTSLLTSFVVLCLIFCGIRQCYRTNKAIDGRDFIERFIILNFPATFKLLAIMLPLAIVVFTATRPFEPSISVQIRMSCAQIGGTLIFYALLHRSFVRLGKLLKSKAKAKENGRHTPNHSSDVALSGGIGSWGKWYLLLLLELFVAIVAGYGGAKDLHRPDLSGPALSAGIFVIMVFLTVMVAIIRKYAHSRGTKLG